MVIGLRLRALREQKNLSQGDIQQRTGLLRCYISRVENGHTIPSLETLEKLAAALDTPLYQLFMTDEDVPVLQVPGARPDGAKASGKFLQAEAAERFLRRFGPLVSRIAEQDRNLVLHIARKLATR